MEALTVALKLEFKAAGKPIVMDRAVLAVSGVRVTFFIRELLSSYLASPCPSSPSLAVLGSLAVLRDEALPAHEHAEECALDVESAL